MKTIAVIGTLDTKGAEHAFLADRIRSLGCNALLNRCWYTFGTNRCTDIRVKRF